MSPSSGLVGRTFGAVTTLDALCVAVGAGL